MTESEFDHYATDYESALQQGLNVSGESSDYFSQGRIEWLARRLQTIGTPSRPNTILDFGCGTGNSIGHLLRILKAARVIGIDTSEQSLVQAKERYRSDETQFETVDRYCPTGDIDLAFCNGVFHHIPVESRAEALRFIWRCLKPGGQFAFWENNPWNPGTRIVMSRIPFDRDAIVISIPQAKRLLIENGFAIACVDTRFYFPKALGWFRFIEPALARLPLGAQYMVLARKVASI